MKAIQLAGLGLIGWFVLSKLKSGAIKLPSVGGGGTPPPGGGSSPPPGGGSGVLDYATACSQARAKMGAQSAVWLNASCQDIQSAVCNSTNIFNGNDPIRVGLCTGYVKPAPQQEPPSSWGLSSSVIPSYSVYVDDFHKQNGRWMDSNEQLDLLVRLMPNAPRTFAQAVAAYVNHIGAVYGCAACDPRPGAWLTHAYQEYWLPVYGGSA